MENKIRTKRSDHICEFSVNFRWRGTTTPPPKKKFLKFQKYVNCRFEKRKIKLQKHVPFFYNSAATINKIKYEYFHIRWRLVVLCISNNVKLVSSFLSIILTLVFAAFVTTTTKNFENWRSNCDVEYVLKNVLFLLYKSVFIFC